MRSNDSEVGARAAAIAEGGCECEVLVSGGCSAEPRDSLSQSGDRVRTGLRLLTPRLREVKDLGIGRDPITATA